MSKTRLLAVLLLLPFVVNGPFFDSPKQAPRIAAPAPQYVEVEAEAIDGRAQVLAAYFAQYDSPLEYQAQHFIDAADRYNLDWRLVAAISGAESTFGKHIPGGYNAWGWGVYGDQSLGFDSWKDGIYTVSEGLRTNYFDRGLTDLFAINRVYAASKHWAYSVDYFMGDIARFESQYNQDQLQKIAFATSFMNQQ